MAGLGTTEYFWCRNCGEETLHKCVGWRNIRTPLFRLFGHGFWRKKRVPFYACTICGCERIYDDERERLREMVMYYGSEQQSDSSKKD